MALRTVVLNGVSLTILKRVNKAKINTFWGDYCRLFDNMDAKLYATWSVLELKAELKRRGASVKGRKADLVERLELYDKNFNFNTPQLSPNAMEPSIVLPPLEMYHDTEVARDKILWVFT
ncbi:unnamed protein product [Colias eurytheme]|nr:unnamed protein product [Colias eurytheme]